MPNLCINCANWKHDDPKLKYGLCEPNKISTNPTEGCNVKFKPKKERLVKAPDGTDLPIIAPTEVADFMENLGKEIYGDKPKKDGIDDVKGLSGVEGGILAPTQVEAKPKKGKKRDLEDFLWMQSRVISKLNDNPEIWEKLDALSSYELKKILFGQSVKEIIPPSMGGQMQLGVSTETKKMFADLEKKFEKEGQKAYDLGDENRLGDVNSLIWDEEPRGGVWVNPKGEKKNGKDKKKPKKNGN